MEIPHDLIDGLRQLNAARPRYDLADQYYDGEPGEIFASDKVKRLLAKANVDEIADFKYSATPVDVVSHRLQVRAVKVIPADESSPVSPEMLELAQSEIAAIISRNELDVEVDHLFHLASKHGDAYLFVWPVTADEIGDDSDEIQEDTDAPGYDEDSGSATSAEQVVAVDIRVNSAHTVRAIYDDEDPLLMSYVIKSWTYHDEKRRPITRANLYYKDRIERWISAPGSNVEARGSWKPFEDDDNPATLPNRSGRIPFFHLRNHRPYGVPEHWRAIGPQQLINKLVITHASTIDYQSFPQRYYMVDPMMDDPLSNVTDPFHPEDDDEDPEDAGTFSPLESNPSAVWKLYGKSAGQFSSADVTSFLNPFDRYVRAMAELTDIPQHHFSKATGETPSGAALRTAEAPLNDKVEKRHKVYGGTLADAYEYSLKLMGFEGIRVQVSWRPSQSVTDTEGWGVVAAKRANGVPAAVALAETGYPPEQIEEWLRTNDGVDLANRVQILLMIGQATQALGAGVALGVLDAPRIAEIIDRVLGTAAGGMPEPIEEEETNGGQ